MGAPSRPLSDEQGHILLTLFNTEGFASARSMFRQWFKTTAGFDATMDDLRAGRKPGGRK